MGTTLTKAGVEQKIRSGKCRHEIRTIGDAHGGRYITKYVVDLSVKPLITEVRIYADKKGHFNISAEYCGDVTYGANVKALAVSLYSEEVMSNDRIAAFLNAASDDELGLSEGSVYGFCKKLAKAAGTSIRHLEDELLNQKVVATDATTITVNGEQNYIRNFSIDQTVVYHAMKSKTIDEMKELRFLKKYTGTLVHDHETALYHFGTEHAECNVHIIRYLRKNTEETGNKWSGGMVSLLREMNNTRKAFMEQGRDAFPEDMICRYEHKYHALISDGREKNKKTSHKYAKSDELTLLNRMDKYSQTICCFCGTLRFRLTITSWRGT